MSKVMLPRLHLLDALVSYIGSEEKAAMVLAEKEHKKVRLNACAFGLEKLMDDFYGRPVKAKVCQNGISVSFKGVVVYFFEDFTEENPKLFALRLLFYAPAIVAVVDQVDYNPTVQLNLDLNPDMV